MRDIATKLPSPSEQLSFAKCPTLWWLRYRAGLSVVLSAARLASGTAVSEAVSVYHLQTRENPIAVYETLMRAEMSKLGAMSEEEWESQIVSDRDALRVYIETKPPVDDDWECVLEMQARIDTKVNLVPDGVVLLKSGFVRPIEFKCVSPFADLEAEKSLYDMGMQPISYTVMASQRHQKPCDSCEMRFLVRSAAARGKYKPLPAKYDWSRVTVEPWKKQMWESSVNFVNAGMSYVDHVASQPGAGLAEIPKFTQNCMVKLGSKTYPCDFYAACSENMHPMQVVGKYVQKEGRRAEG